MLVLRYLEDYGERGGGGGDPRLLEHYLVDLATGSVRPAHVPAAPDLDGAYHPWTFGDAAWLSPAAAHLAFTP